MKDYWDVTKPGIAIWVMCSGLLGYLMAGGNSWGLGISMAIGVGLSAMSSGCLNQWMERREDALMDRTARRPIASGRLSSDRALGFGLVLGAAGLSILWRFHHPLCLGLTALTMGLYLAVYTPLKKRTPQCSWVGAAAGASSPLIGWAAARGELGFLAWVLFGIQFLWQIPHFLTLFWMYRDQYAKAGFRVMPVMDATGGLTASQIAIHSLGVVPLSVLPALSGLSGIGAGLAVLAVGTAYLGIGLRASWTLALVDTRRLFLASLIYLPLVFSVLAWGRI